MRAGAILLLLLLGLGCEKASPGITPAPGGIPDGTASADTIPADTSQPPAEAALPDSFEGTAGISDFAPVQQGTAVLRAVRSARHEGFDRVVFEFVGDVLPGYHIEYVDKPVRDCGSGDPVPMAGDGWLQVQFHVAQAHTDEGKPTIPWREQTVSHPNLREIQRTCDFEGYVTYVLGVGSPNRYRAERLTAPPRLVVDIRH